MHGEEGVADFLASRLEKRADEQKRRVEQRAQTNRANLGFLLVTWRFILVTRAAFIALAAAALQYTLQNLGSFVDTTRFVPVFEKLFGRETLILSVVRLITPGQAANLVAIVIISIVAVIIAIDMSLSKLQIRCAVIGANAEDELQVHGLFSEIQKRQRNIALPFYIARFAILLVGATALWYLIFNR